MIWVPIVLLFLKINVFAFDYPYTIRSPEGLLMGDAYTAVNADEFTMFYNPATLARHKKDFSLFPFNPQLSGTNVLNDVKRLEEFQDGQIDASEVLMDYPIHASAGIAPGFKLFNVGVSFFASENYDLLLRNPSHPMLYSSHFNFPALGPSRPDLKIISFRNERLPYHRTKSRVIA